MASIDLKDAFYSVPVVVHYQKYLQLFTNEYLKFTYVRNGYGLLMRIFTNITKVPFSVLTMQGHTLVVYVHDSYLQGDCYERMHINMLQPKVAFIGIRTHCHNKSCKYIRVMSGSSAAIAYINNKGSIMSKIMQ